MPVRVRIALLILLCLSPVVTLSSWFLVRRSTTQLWSEAEKDGTSLADTVLSATRHSMLTVDRTELEAILEAVSRQKGVRSARVYDGKGRFRAPTTRPAPDLDLGAPACVRCHRDTRVPEAGAPPARAFAHRGEDGLRLFLRVPNEPECSGVGCHAAADSSLGILEVGLDLSSELARERRLALWSVGWGVVILAGATIPLFFAFRRAMERPLAECLRLVRRIAAGDLGVRSRVRRRDEWGELLGAVDAMTGALADARERLEVLNRDLERQVADRTRELRTALELARESDRTKMEFLTGISHEFTNPLQGAIGYAELLRDGIDGELAPGQREDVEVILRNCRFLLELVEDLLQLARLGGAARPARPGRVRLEDVARTAVAAWAETAGERAAAPDVAADPDCPPVSVDEAALTHLLHQLLSYATRQRHAGAGGIAVEVRRSGAGGAAVSVATPGPGSEAEALRSALKGYSPRGGGGAMGVRIALARRLVELSGGVLEVEALEQGGTRVTVRFPPAAEAAEPRPS